MKGVDMGIFIMTHLFEFWKNEAVGDDAGAGLAVCFEKFFELLHAPREQIDEDDVCIVEVCPPKVLPSDGNVGSIGGEQNAES